MNKLKVSEGGQPIYLDDLVLLQHLPIDTNKALLDALTGGAVAFLLQAVTTSVVAAGLRVGAGVLVYKGELYPLEATDLSGVTAEEVYICLKETETDMRLFDDGQQRPCRVQLTAYATTSPSGAAHAFRLEDLKTLVDLVGKTLGIISDWQTLPFVGYNNYVGRMLTRTLPDANREFRLELSSNLQDWNIPSYIGVMTDFNVASLLTGKQITYSQGATTWTFRFFPNGLIRAASSGEALEGEDVPNVWLPSLSLRWKISDMTTY